MAVNEALLVKAEHAGAAVIAHVRVEIIERVAVIKSLRKMLRDARHEAEHFAERREGDGIGRA
jgi:hypothetical protein